MSHCAGHDPITAAGTMNCGACHAESWPRDAAWMPDGAILTAWSTFHAPGCPQPRDYGTVLIIPGGDGHLPPVRRPCLATARTTRKPCRNRAIQGSLYCWWHSGQEAAR